jgi:hypothetical protein
MREAKFSIDLLGDQLFDGYTKGETWNGWACPYFNFEQGQQIVAATNRAAAEWLKRDQEFNTLHGQYDSKLDAFIFYYRMESGSQTPEEDWDIFPAEEINGMKLYPIGAGCWVWEHASEQINNDSADGNSA